VGEKVYEDSGASDEEIAAFHAACGMGSFAEAMELQKVMSDLSSPKSPQSNLPQSFHSSSA
jgi:hypothetical protein